LRIIAEIKNNHGGDMKKSTQFLVILVVAMAVFATACSSNTATSTTAPASTASQEGAALVQDRCTACHNLSRVESLRLSASDWSTVADQMISRGAKLTPAEKTIVVNYLATNYGK
jgi:cytochrome c-type biogenesis protein CcmH/NrfF